MIDSASSITPNDITNQRSIECLEIVKDVGNTSNRSKEQEVIAKTAIDAFHDENANQAVLVYTDGSIKNRQEKCLTISIGYGACSSIVYDPDEPGAKKKYTPKK